MEKFDARAPGMAHSLHLCGLTLPSSLLKLAFSVFVGCTPPPSSLSQCLPNPKLPVGHQSPMFGRKRFLSQNLSFHCLLCSHIHFLAFKYRVPLSNSVWALESSGNVTVRRVGPVGTGVICWGFEGGGLTQRSSLQKLLGTIFIQAHG